MAEAGSLGGGILSYLGASTSFTATSRGFDELRMRFKLNFRLIADAEKENSVSTGLNFSSTFGVIEKLGARGPLGLACTLIRFDSALNLGRM